MCVCLRNGSFFVCVCFSFVSILIPRIIHGFLILATLPSQSPSSKSFLLACPTLFAQERNPNGATAPSGLLGFGFRVDLAQNLNIIWGLAMLFLALYGSLLYTILHFCYNKTLIRKKMIIFNISPTRSQILVWFMRKSVGGVVDGLGAQSGSRLGQGLGRSRRVFVPERFRV